MPLTAFIRAVTLDHFTYLVEKCNLFEFTALPLKEKRNEKEERKEGGKGRRKGQKTRREKRREK